MSYIDEFCSALDSIPTPMHYINWARQKLLNKGYTELKETEYWENIPDKFFVARDERSLIAISKKDLSSGLLVAAHIDSPCFRAKPLTSLSRCGIDQARAAPYGGGQWRTWYDRDLKIAGRLIYQDGDSIKSKLFESEYPVAIIPSLAIHLNRDLSTQNNINLEDDIMPILQLSSSNQELPPNLSNQSPSLMSAISECTGVELQNFIDFDVYFVDAQGPVVLGTEREFLSAPRLDDLSSAIPGLEAFIESPDPSTGMKVFLAFDAEEIGSNLRTGAKSNFLNNILEILKVPLSFGANSLLISADNVHANHPEYQNKTDQNHPISLGGGVSYAWNSNYNVATDLSSLTELQQRTAQVLKPCVARNDVSHGSTVGPTLAAQLGIRTVDLGIPLLGMHSIHETCAVKDIDALLEFLKTFYASSRQE